MSSFFLKSMSSNRRSICEGIRNSFFCACSIIKAVDYTRYRPWDVSPQSAIENESAYCMSSLALNLQNSVRRETANIYKALLFRRSALHVLQISGSILRNLITKIKRYQSSIFELGLKMMRLLTSICAINTPLDWQYCIELENNSLL